MMTNEEKAAMTALQNKVDRLALELANKEADWRKLCAIIDVPSGNPRKVFSKLRLMMADVPVEDSIRPELIEARKHFPALDQLHMALDNAMVKTWQGMDLTKDLPRTVRVVKYERMPFSNRLKQFGNWWRNRHSPNDHS
jgi:hypothetical protein